MDGYKKVLSNKNLRLSILNFFGFIPDKPMIRLLYRIKTGERLNLKSPETYTEKLQWLKLNDRRPEYSDMVDKLKMKDYVAKKVGGSYTVPVLGVWDSAGDIDFDSLPDGFTIKCNHDSGSIRICRDKSSFDAEGARKSLAAALKRDCSSFGREWPYRGVERKIFAEELLHSDSPDGALTDYKFFCFDGKPLVMYISDDRGDDPHTDFFDAGFNPLPMRMRDPSSPVPPEKPAKFEEMKAIAAALSEGIPHLRVDFYCIGDRLYVGELTFYPNSGFTKIQPDEWNRRMGGFIDLSAVKRQH